MARHARWWWSDSAPYSIDKRKPRHTSLYAGAFHRFELPSRRLGRFIWIDDAPYKGRQCCTDERADDEDPQVSQCRSALEERRTDGTCRVDRRTRITDADEVDKHERQANGQASKARRGAVRPSRCAQHNQHEDTGKEDLGLLSARDLITALEMVSARAA